MQYSIVQACLLALAATTSVVAQTAGFNVITKPTEGELVAAGETYTIEWIPSLPSADVSIVVLQGASNITLQLGETIASGVQSSAGKFEWAVPAVAPFAVYGIKIQLDSDPNTFQYSNQFKIAVAEEVTPVVVPTTTSAAATTTPAPVIDDASDSPETLTEYETKVSTIYSCAPTVTDCIYGAHTTVVPVVVPATTAAALSTLVQVTGTAPVEATPYPTAVVPVAHYQNGTLIATSPATEASSAGAASPSGAVQSSTPIFTGAAGSVAVSSLTLVGAAAISLLFL